MVLESICSPTFDRLAISRIQSILDFCIVATDQSVDAVQVYVRVCGVLLVDVRLRPAAFEGRTGGRLCGQHTLARARTVSQIAIHPAGTHLVGSDWSCNALIVYELPSMTFLTTLGSYGDGPTNLDAPSGLCFTAAGTLLVADCDNDRVQHWTLGGSSINSYAMQRPECVALHGNTFAVGTLVGVRVFSLESSTELHAWLDTGYVCSIAFANADTIAVSSYTQDAVGLYTLEGKLLKQLGVNVLVYGLGMCIDGCLLVGDCKQKRIFTFALDGTELTTSPLTAHIFQSGPSAIALYGTRVYVIEEIFDESMQPAKRDSVRISMFE